MLTAIAKPESLTTREVKVKKKCEIIVNKLSIDVFLGFKENPNIIRVDVEMIFQHKDGPDLDGLDLIVPFLNVENVRECSERLFDQDFGNYLYTKGWHIIDNSEAVVHIDGVDTRVLSLQPRLGTFNGSTLIHLDFSRYRKGHSVAKAGNFYSFVFSFEMPLSNLVSEGEHASIDIRVYDLRQINDAKYRVFISNKLVPIEMTYLWLVLPEGAKPKIAGPIWGLLETSPKKNPWTEPARIVFVWEQENLHEGVRPLRAYCEYEIYTSAEDILRILKDVITDRTSFFIVCIVTKEGRATATDVAKKMGMIKSGSSRKKIRNVMETLRERGIFISERRVAPGGGEYFKINPKHPISRIKTLLKKCNL